MSHGEHIYLQLDNNVRSLGVGVVEIVCRVRHLNHDPSVQLIPPGRLWHLADPTAWNVANAQK